MSAQPIPMLARPLDIVFGPPDPERRMVTASRGGQGIWLAPVNERTVDQWHVNPGAPGEPELLPWKWSLEPTP